MLSRSYAVSLSGEAQAAFRANTCRTYAWPDPTSAREAQYEDEYVSLDLSMPDDLAMHGFMVAAMADGMAVLDEDLYVVGLHPDFLRGEAMVVVHLRRLDEPPFEHDDPRNCAVED